MSAPEIRSAIRTELALCSRRERRLGDVTLANLVVSRINARGNMSPSRQDLNRWQQIAENELRQQRLEAAKPVKLV